MSDYYNKLKELLINYQYDYKTRLGRNMDGGYVVACSIGNYDCYLSCGIERDDSFSVDFLNHYQVDNCHAFDGTIDKYPENIPNIKFHKMNIGSECTNDTTDLKSYLNDYKNIFIKMDIEDAEFDWINSVGSLIKSVKQFVVELHWLCSDTSEEHRSKVLNALTLIKDNYYIIHSHANTCSRVMIEGIPDVLEITCIRRCDINGLPYNRVPYPIGIDYPNFPNHYQIRLLDYPFVFNNYNK